MSDLIVNIRVFDVHFQISRNKPWVLIGRNAYHRDNNWPDGWFSVYQFFS